MARLLLPLTFSTGPQHNASMAAITPMLACHGFAPSAGDMVLLLLLLGLWLMAAILTLINFYWIIRRVLDKQAMVGHLIWLAASLILVVGLYRGWFDISHSAVVFAVPLMAIAQFLYLLVSAILRPPPPDNPPPWEKNGF